MQCGDYSPRRKSHPTVKPSRSLLVDGNISTSSEASREKKPNRQTHHSDSQFLRNDPLKHRRVSSLSERHLSARVLYKAERGMNECVLGTQHWQWLYTTPTTASIKNRKIKSFQISLGHFLSSSSCAHVGVFDSFLLSLYVQERCAVHSFLPQQKTA